jgi:hypothetical protein
VQFANAMVYDEKLKPKAVKKIIKKLKAKKPTKKCLLLIKVHPSNQLLEIVTYRELYRMIERDKSIAIIGMAKNREAIFHLIEELMVRLYGTYQGISSDIIDKEFELIWSS